MASSNWCVDKYKSEFESEEHWLLRKKFMETHKDKFPEKKLVCLARVFFNVEFLGCKYPEKTMQLVADLSRGVADEFREKQKGKLKRTFVQASDAAGAKIKGAPPKAELPSKLLKTPPWKNGLSNNESCSLASHTQTFVAASSAAELPSKMLKTPPLKHGLSNNESCNSTNCTQNIADSGPFPGFVIYVHCDLQNNVEKCPCNILMHSASKSSKWKEVQFNFPVDKITPTGQRICEVSINNKFLSSGEGLSNKEAKVNAAVEALKTLRKTCYTIQAKCPFYSETGTIGKTGLPTKDDTDKPLPQDNIGSRMMQKMGWTGSGLGKQKQGIQEPVKAFQIMKRKGLGSMDKKMVHNGFRRIFKDYITSNSDHDLVFETDFSHDERKTLHNTEDNEEEIEEDNSKDLFGSDSEFLNIGTSEDEDDLDRTKSSGLENSKETSTCIKLPTLTGEESDDDVYDIIWNTASDTTGLVQIADCLSECDNEETDDDVCDMEICDDADMTEVPIEDAPFSNSSVENVGKEISIASCFSKHESLKTNFSLPTSFLKKCDGTQFSGVEKVTMINKNIDNSSKGRDDNQSGTPVEVKSGSKTPDDQGPRAAVPKLRRYRAKQIRFFLPNGSFKRIYVRDIKHNKEILEYHKNSQHVTIEDLRRSKALCTLFPEYVSSHKELIEPAETKTNTDVDCKNRKRGKAKRLRFFLPDGSVRRLPWRCIQGNKELVDYIAHTRRVTFEDLRTNKALSELFSNFVSSHKELIEAIGKQSNDAPNIECNSEFVPFDKKYNSEAHPYSSDFLDEDSSSEESSTAESETSQSSTINLTDLQSVTNKLSPSNNPTKVKKIRGGGRVLVTFTDGSFARINRSYLKSNKYFQRYCKRKQHMKTLDPSSLSCLPPPIYSDSSADESEQWVPKISSHLSNSQQKPLDKKAILGKQWEQFLISFGSSKTNPISKKWRDFVDGSNSNEKPAEDETLAIKWRDFMLMKDDSSQKIVENTVGGQSNRGPFELTDNKVDDIEKTRTKEYCVIEEKKRPLTSHFQFQTKTSNLFGSDDQSQQVLNEKLQKHLLETGADSSASNLESHLKSSTVATVHSSSPLPSTLHGGSVSKFVKIENPNIVTVYLPDGSKMKLNRHLLHGIKKKSCSNAVRS